MSETELDATAGFTTRPDVSKRLIDQKDCGTSCYDPVDMKGEESHVILDPCVQVASIPR